MRENRTWITREEIAEIHDSIAKRLSKQAVEILSTSKSQSRIEEIEIHSKSLMLIQHANVHNESAQLMRYADNMRRVRT